MDENIKETLEKINWSSLVIKACAHSMDYIQKDLEELEITANSIAENHFLGLINIVEQLSYIIKSEAEKIMEISD